MMETSCITLNINRAVYTVQPDVWSVYTVWRRHFTIIGTSAWIHTWSNGFRQWLKPIYLILILSGGLRAHWWALVPVLSAFWWVPFQLLIKSYHKKIYEKITQQLSLYLLAYAAGELLLHNYEHTIELWLIKKEYQSLKHIPFLKLFALLSPPVSSMTFFRH